MQVEDIRRWQWILIGLAAGALLAQMRRSDVPALTRGGQIIAGRREFENAVIEEFRGHRRFENLTIRPAQLTDDAGAVQRVHLVMGDYFTGQLEMIDGQLVARWRPACFLAESPFRPPASTLGDEETVMHYLDGKGIRYTHAWWHEPPWPTVFWSAGGVLVIGIVWPTMVNLLIFGSIFAPRQARGTNLRNVRQTPAVSTPMPTDLAEADQMAAAMEAELAAEAGRPGRPSNPPKPQASSALVRHWAAGEPQALPAPEPGDEKAYGKAKDDFYPTEVHAPPKNG